MDLLAPSTNNQYRGARAAPWFLGLAGVLTLVPGLIHTFLPDGGAVSIAGLDVGERRDLVVRLFAWHGATQIAYGLFILLAAFRYRSLTPLLLALFVLERLLLSLDAWVLDAPAGGHRPPEHYGSLAGLALGAVFLALSLRRRP